MEQARVRKRQRKKNLQTELREIALYWEAEFKRGDAIFDALANCKDDAELGAMLAELRREADG